MTDEIIEGAKIDPSRIIEVDIAVAKPPSLDDPGRALEIDEARRQAIEVQLSGRGLQVELDDQTGRLLVSGPAHLIEAAFEVELGDYHDKHGPSYTGARDRQALAPWARDLPIVGLDEHTRIPPPTPAGSSIADEAVFTLPDLLARYDFPVDTAEQRCIGILICGGGFIGDDLPTFFEAQNLPTPGVSVICVDGASNTPCPHRVIAAVLLAAKAATPPPPYVGSGELLSSPSKAKGGGGPPESPNSGYGTTQQDPDEATVAWTIEALMDVEIAGVAGVGADIRVYRTTSGARGFTRAIYRAALDGVDVLSMSFGYDESSYSPEELAALEQAMAFAASKGVTVVVSSGNSGSTQNGETLSVQYPASSPWVLTVGGTMIHEPGSAPDETVWNEEALGTTGASGGGFSTRLPAPPWQALAGPHRGLPDVAANASFGSGAWLWMGGVNTRTAGTSAAAPLWAGLLARCAAVVGGATGLGLVTPRIYAAEGTCCTNIDVGDNRIIPNVEQFAAGPGWDPCTGWGTPVGTQILAQILSGD